MKPCHIHSIDLAFELDPESKLDRNPRFIRRLMQHGEDQAESFLANHKA
jgi:hypothetical protein